MTSFSLVRAPGLTLFRACNFFENFDCGLGPNERLWISIVIFEVSHDGAIEIVDALEDAAADTLSGNLGEEPLDHVEPHAFCSAMSMVSLLYLPCDRQSITGHDHWRHSWLRKSGGLLSLKRRLKALRNVPVEILESEAPALVPAVRRHLRRRVDGAVLGAVRDGAHDGLAATGS